MFSYFGCGFVSPVYLPSDFLPLPSINTWPSSSSPICSFWTYLHLSRLSYTMSIPLSDMQTSLLSGCLALVCSLPNTWTHLLLNLWFCADLHTVQRYHTYSCTFFFFLSLVSNLNHLKWCPLKFYKWPWTCLCPIYLSILFIFFFFYLKRLQTQSS